MTDDYAPLILAIAMLIALVLLFHEPFFRSVSGL